MLNVLERVSRFSHLFRNPSFAFSCLVQGETCFGVLRFFTFTFVSCFRTPPFEFSSRHFLQFLKAYSATPKRAPTLMIGTLKSSAVIFCMLHTAVQCAKPKQTHRLWYPGSPVVAGGPPSPCMALRCSEVGSPSREASMPRNLVSRNASPIATQEVND